MKHTSGIFLYSIPDKKFLVGHVTNSSFYSIPKGEVEQNEGYFTTAKRELFEETNIKYEDLNVANVQRLPKQKYKSKKKILHPYLVCVFNSISEFEVKCNSVIDNTDIPEFDGFEWATLKTPPNLHKTQIDSIAIILKEKHHKNFDHSNLDGFFAFTEEDLKDIIRPIRGLSVDYIIKCALDQKIQKEWVPQIGDMILGITGNMFVISAVDEYAEEVGGTQYYFGGHKAWTICENKRKEIYSCYVFNNDGVKYKLIDANFEPLNYLESFGMSSKKDFRFIPYIN